MQKRLLGMLASVAIVLSACGGATTSSSPASAPPAASAPAASTEGSAPAPSASEGAIDTTTTTYKPEAVGHTGGKLVMATSGEPNTIWFNEYDTFAADTEAFGFSLWGLWNATTDFKYYPNLATNVPNIDNGGVTVNGDKMDVTIELVPGGQWSDGEPITCQDLTDQWHWQMDDAQVGNVQGKTGWEDIASIDGGTTTSCVVHFSKVFEQYLGLWAPLLPSHYLKTAAVAEAQDKLYTHGKPEDVAKGVYSGPYMPTSWLAGTQIDYVPNPKYWETIKKSTAPFDAVTFRFYTNPQAMVAGFQNGEFDLGIELNHTHIPLLAALDPATVINDPGTTYEQHSWNYASLTTKFGADGAKALMTALHYAYDKDAINQRVIGGTAIPTCNFASNLSWFYADIPCYKTDIAKANQILDDAGFTKGADGVRTMNSKPVSLVACARADRQYRIDTLRLLGDQLTAIGVTLDLTNVATDPGVLFSGWSGPDAAPADAPCNLTHGNFDVAEFAWVATLDPTSIHGLYDSKKDPTEGDHSGQNYIRVKNPELDTMLEGMLRTVDLQEIKKTMSTIQDLYVTPENAFPEIALYQWANVAIKTTKLHNFSNNSTAATQTWNIEDYWLDQ
jgi:peptide/nickel transport system substrate-binding protein